MISFKVIEAYFYDSSDSMTPDEAEQGHKPDSMYGFCDAALLAEEVYLDDCDWLKETPEEWAIESLREVFNHFQEALDAPIIDMDEIRAGNLKLEDIKIWEGGKDAD
jgi:hypothetical protein